MIIFGTRGVTYNHENGDFFCPTCRAKRGYAHKRVRRFFTLYFIPLIPMDLLGEYIECAMCRDTYQIEVLNFNPEQEDQKFEAEFRRAMRRVMVLMMLADGVIEDSEVEMIRELYGKMSGAPVTDAEVRGEAKDALEDGLTAKDYLGKLVGTLNDEGKEMVVKAAFMVAISDGEIPQEEKDLLAEIGNALQLSKSHFNGIIDSMTSEEANA